MPTKRPPPRLADNPSHVTPPFVPVPNARRSSSQCKGAVFGGHASLHGTQTRDQSGSCVGQNSQFRRPCISTGTSVVPQHAAKHEGTQLGHSTANSEALQSFLQSIKLLTLFQEEGLEIQKRWHRQYRRWLRRIRSRIPRDAHLLPNKHFPDVPEPNHAALLSYDLPAS